MKYLKDLYTSHKSKAQKTSKAAIKSEQAAVKAQKSTMFDHDDINTQWSDFTL